MLQPGVECTGHNWCATLIKLGKSRVLNLVTSNIPHGTTQDGTRTIIEVNQYLDQYKVPYVCGGDFNRSTDDFQEQQVRQGHHYVVAPSDQSTCLGGGRIDYFVTNGAREHIGGRFVTVPGKVRPHVPAHMRGKYRPHLTKVCGLARLPHNLSEGLEQMQAVRKKGTLALANECSAHMGGGTGDL